jgi:hypothetical protein
MLLTLTPQEIAFYFDNVVKIIINVSDMEVSGPDEWAKLLSRIGA